MFKNKKREYVTLEQAKEHMSTLDILALEAGINDYLNPKNKAKTKFLGYVDNTNFRDLAKAFGYRPERSAFGWGMVVGVSGVALAGYTVKKYYLDKRQTIKAEEIHIEE